MTWLLLTRSNELIVVHAATPSDAVEVLSRHAILPEGELQIVGHGEVHVITLGSIPSFRSYAGR